MSPIHASPAPAGAHPLASPTTAPSHASMAPGMGLTSSRAGQSPRTPTAAATATLLATLDAWTDAGLLRRWTDPKDRRRDLIALTEGTAANMKEYLGAVNAVLQKA